MPTTKRPQHASILAQVQAIRREKKLEPLRFAQQECARVLDGLNAWGALDALRAARFSPLLCWGPAAFDGLTPMPWVGVLIWHRASGYFGYKTLTLLGAWACAQGEGDALAVRVVIGTRALPFAAPFYEPEAYHKLMRKGFDLYYKPDTPPPADAAGFVYDPAARLAQRDQLAVLLAQQT